MERRKFLGYTAAAGVALMLHPFETFAIPPGKKIRLALVGRRISALHHARQPLS